VVVERAVGLARTFKISCLQTNIEEGFLEQLNANKITDLMS
jgi:hypothetical protein